MSGQIHLDSFYYIWKHKTLYLYYI